MKTLWAGAIGCFEGAAGAALVGGVLVGVLDWRLDSTPRIAAYAGAILACAVAGWFVGSSVARQKARAVTR
ncbi:MAG: hypothetical protein WDO12_03255 [Pseudomonadota bacterium]